MLLENTRMREMMLKARMMFRLMNTSRQSESVTRLSPNHRKRQDSQARGGSISVGGRCEWGKCVTGVGRGF